MLPPDFVLQSQRVVTPEGVRPAEVEVRQGKIRRIRPISPIRPIENPATPLLDCGDSVVMPGIVDTHVLLLEASSIGGEASALLTQEDVDALAEFLDRFRTPAEA